MLTDEEADALARCVRRAFGEDIKGSTYQMNQLLALIKRETDQYAPGHGTDVIADGPKISTRQMLDEAARALGWRTDWACGDSPITWDLVLEEIRKLKNRRVIDVMTCVQCNGRLAVKESTKHKTVGVCIDCLSSVTSVLPGG